MPFPPQTPMPFRREIVEEIDEGQLGCYGLLRGETYVFIGKGDIRARLLAHLGGDEACVTRERPTRWVGVVTPRADDLLPELVRDHAPLCNPGA
ncbi:MAG: hypothetical protein ACREID_00305 [Planctomycetota bacterium]